METPSQPENREQAESGAAAGDRRSWLAASGAMALGAVAYAAPVVGGLAAFLNPLRQKGSGGQFLRIASLETLPDDGTPRKFPVVTERVDAWTRSVEPVGAVYLRRTGENQIEALQAVCPHAGCTVDYKDAVGEGAGGKTKGFFCPCHKATFDLAGKRLERVSHSPRDLDTLDVEIRNGTEVWVQFQNFNTGTPDKVPSSMNAPTKSKNLVDWLDDRTGLPTAIRQCAESAPAAGAWLGRIWPSVILFVFVVQVVTGLVLWMHYTPSAQSAWESVYYMQYEVAGGWLVRGVHHYAAQVLVALVGLYVFQLVLFGSYRRPREFVFWIAVFMGLTSLGLCLTGDLLSWDQNRFTATQTRVNFAMLVPIVGSDLFKIAAGGPTFGHLTLARFFALHVGAFAAGFCALLVLHFWLARRASRSSTDSAKPGAPYWPTQFLQNSVAWLVVMIVILLLVFQHGFTGDHEGKRPAEYLGVELGAPADTDPAAAYAAARPEWSFRGLYELAHMFTGAWQIIPIFILPGAAVTYVLLMPLIGISRVGHVLNVLVMIALVAALGYLSLRSYRTDWNDPDYRAAVEEGEAKAQRVIELAQAKGIPATGALTLLRNDPKIQGPGLFEQHCAACHSFMAPEPKSIVAEEPSAPELYQFAGREWLAGFLDPEEIKSDQYYGNTRFAAGIMVTYVEGHFADVDDDSKQAIIAALSAEAKLKSQADADTRDKELLAKGKELIHSEGCTRCHSYYEHGAPGDAPDLTGYGSREWLIGVIADPTHGWFYGPRNDRMPAYVEFPEEPAKNRLSSGQLDALATWLRGEWFEPGAEAAEGETEGQKQTSPLIALGKWEARRARDTAPPPTGPKGQALAFFKMAQCNLCHDYTDDDGQGIKSREPNAPSLYRFASEEWVRGILDPDQVDGPKYFGTNEEFKEGTMVSYVKDDLPDYLSDMGSVALEDLVADAMDDGKEVEFAIENLKELKDELGEEELRKQATKAVEDEEFEDFVEDNADDDLMQRLGQGKLEELIAALAAEAQHDEPQEVDEDTEFLFEDFGCTECHKFHNVGELGNGPDLTGYGSRGWLVGIITAPEHERFYPDTNDGMPSYHAFPDQPQKNLLTVEQMQQLADLLRGKLEKPSADSEQSTD